MPSCSRASVLWCASTIALAACGSVGARPDAALDSGPAGRGMVVPAYLPPSDTASWTVLKEGAAIMNGSHKDYWVVANGPSNGPFASAADWTAAAGVWDPLTAAGGKVFGYVHTCTTTAGPLFRPLADVEADITAWVAGYPKLYGIWIDEFYPRFEIAGSDGASATFPNGQQAAPTDRSFLNPDNTFNASQVNPAGGYYDQLTRWLRAQYPDLKIIGNAGGHFYSNQINYIDLVDATCSFEQDYDHAANAPTNDWATLNRQNTAKHGQLALIHGNTSDLSGAVMQAFMHGYDYVYTTSRTPSDNLWDGLPSYFTSEVQLIAGQP